MRILASAVRPATLHAPCWHSLYVFSEDFFYVIYLECMCISISACIANDHCKKMLKVVSENDSLYTQLRR